MSHIHSRGAIRLCFCLLILLLLTACAGSPASPSATIAQPFASATPVLAYTLTPAPRTPTPSPDALRASGVTPTALPPALISTPVDYQPMLDDIQAYLNTSGLGPDFDLSVGFVDMISGQTVDFDGTTRHYGLSTFKGPLAAFYLWLVERGELEPQDDDIDYLLPMLEISDNSSTTCVIRRVGGLAAFNDWLADQGFSRENNFVHRWQNWACRAGGDFYLAPLDLRYRNGDAGLGIPGDYALLNCEPRHFVCEIAFAPLELAVWYARLYQGEVLSEGSTDLLLGWLEDEPGDAAVLGALPEEAGARAYVKNGFMFARPELPYNFWHEAGIVQTRCGPFAIAVFTRGNPNWPATEPIGEVTRIAWEHFSAGHLCDQPDEGTAGDER